MKFLRNRIISKFIASLLLMLMIQSVMAPTISWALTNGPHQPEYTAYEEPGATDMVNLLTGDFSFRIPAIDIPGPEGGFSMPLSYNAGIGLDQEASWVGLGWSLNAGAIARNVVEFPDDASGESFQIHRADDDIARGWTSSVPGIGQLGWDSNEGHYGRISILGLLGASYKNGSLTGGNVVGVNFSSKKVTVDPVALMSAVVTIATFGAGAAASAGTAAAGEAGKAAALSIAKDAAISVAVEGVVTAATGVASPGFNMGGFWQLTKEEDKRLFHTNYWVWLDQTRYEDMFGTLYLQNMPKSATVAYYNSNPNITSHPTTPAYVTDADDLNDQGAASDMHYAWNGNDYYTTYNPTSLAIDNYSVMGPGVSGAIAPYRLDVGSLAMPRDMTNNHIKVAIAPHRDYKVAFKYKGEHSNSYYHHIGKSGAFLDWNDMNYGINHLLSNSNTATPTDLTYGYSDNILGDYTTQMEGDRYGLWNNKLAQSKNVEWYSNQELIAGVNGFIDCMSTVERSNLVVGVGAGVDVPILRESGNYKLVVGKGTVNLFTVNEDVDIQIKYHHFFTGLSDIETNATVTSKGIDYIIVDVDLDDNFAYMIEGKVSPTSLSVENSTIGGYKITREDGRTYHYSLPIYDWSNYTKIWDKVETDQITEISRIEPFPSTWLLTAITGSDYVDRNSDNTLDEGDWGYWVDFDYGKFSNNYKWRMPYTEESRSSNDQSNSYSVGNKEQYYLNKIQTRTHTALFIKEMRQDGRGANSSNHSSTLGLDEVILLSNEDYSSYESNLSTTISNDNTAVSWLSENDTFEKTLDTYDINASTRNWLNQNALKRVKFHYNYSLAKGTTNSFDISASGNKSNISSLGKLTLNSISIYGRNNVKTVPDFVFDYEENPDYDQHDWDGWGMYNPGGSSSGYTHMASPNNLHGTAWSLSEVTTPLGNKMQIEYERDSYSSVAGNNVAFPHSFSGPSWSSLSVTSPGSLTVGETVTVSGKVYQTCNNGAEVEGPYTSVGFFNSYDTKVLAIAGNNVTLGKQPPPVPCDDAVPGDNSPGTVTSYEGTINRVIDKKGGNTRVKSITATDGVGEAYKTRYLYTDDSSGKVRSTGVVAQEPDYIKTSATDYSFYNLFDFPNTPVMYGKVTVLSGKLSNDEDYHTKQIYDFTTPNFSMITRVMDYEDGMNKKKIGGQQVFGIDHEEYLTKAHHKIDINTSEIGKLNSVKIYDSNDGLIHQTEMNYSDLVVDDIGQGHQGIFTESTLMFEKLINQVPGTLEIYHRAFRTTKRYFPTFLESVTTTNADGLQTITENKQWDFITGKVLKKYVTDPLGIKTLSETIPAYKEYPEMGSKAENPSYSHMLGADVATYVYKLDASDNKIGLIGASVQTWKKSWDSYREANASTGNYENIDNSHDRWRRHASYLWQGDQSDLQDDGTLSFSESDRFNFSASTHTGWQYGGEVTRYDYHSMPVESKDLNNIHTTTKTNIDKSAKVLEAGNAKYTEVAYSGSEYDYQTVGGKTYLDGEVRITASSQLSTAKSHTGAKSVKISSAGQKGYHYVMQSGEYDANRNYRLGVWVHQDNMDKAELYYKLGSSTYTPTSTVHSADSWRRLEMLIPGSALNGAVLEVGVRKKTSAGSGDVYVDDFRFQPMDAGMTGYVYDDRGQLTHMLDNENRFTQYVYNDAGRLTTTYVETFKYGKVKVSDSDRHYSNMNQ